MTAQILVAIVGYALTGAFVGGRMCGMDDDVDTRVGKILAAVFLWPFILAACLGFPHNPALPVAKVLK